MCIFYVEGFFKMKELEFENFELSGNNPENNQERNPSAKLSDYSSAISFSAKLVDLLKQKIESHNQNNPSNKTNLSELKEVFRIGAHSTDNKSQAGLARVNMFLRKKCGENTSKIQEFDKKEEVISEGIASIKSLQFDVDPKDALDLDSLDATDKDYPDDEDFAQADIDIETYKLDYDFNDVNDLYLDDYEPLGFDGDW